MTPLEPRPSPPATRESRELVRYRAKLVAIRSGFKAQVHALLGKAGLLIATSDMFGLGAISDRHRRDASPCQEGRVGPRTEIVRRVSTVCLPCPPEYSPAWLWVR